MVIGRTFEDKDVERRGGTVARLAVGQELTAPEMFRALAGTSRLTCAAGAFICVQGNPVDSWMGIIDGLGKLASFWTTGKTKSLIGISAGGWFGEGSLPKNEPRRYDIMALRATRGP